MHDELPNAQKIEHYNTHTQRYLHKQAINNIWCGSKQSQKGWKRHREYKSRTNSRATHLTHHPNHRQWRQRKEGRRLPISPAAHIPPALPNRRPLPHWTEKAASSAPPIVVSAAGGVRRGSAQCPSREVPSPSDAGRAGCGLPTATTHSDAGRAGCGVASGFSAMLPSSTSARTTRNRAVVNEMK